VIACPSWTGFGVIDPIVATGAALGPPDPFTVNRKLPLPIWLLSPGKVTPIKSVVALVPNGVNVAKHVADAVEPDNVHVENAPAPLLTSDTAPVGVMKDPAVELSVTIAVQLVGEPTVTGEVHETDVTVVLGVTVIVTVGSGLAAE
jgi:hypothetical protein